MNKKIPFKEIINYFAVSMLFFDAFSYMRLSFFEIKIYYFIIPVIFMLLFIIVKGLYLNVKFISIISVLFLSSFINILLGHNSFPLLAKQLTGILFTSMFFYILLKANNYDVPKIFKIYLNLTFAVALIGLIQEISYLLKFRMGYDFGSTFGVWKYHILVGTPFIRVNSILPEPTHFCNVTIPALFASIYSLSTRSFKLQNNWRSSVIISAFLLTFSLTGYIVAIFSTMLLIYNFNKTKYIWFISLIILLSSVFVYLTVPEVKRKCQQTISVLAGQIKLEDVNLSTYALTSNAFVAFNSFSHNPIFGLGIGSHQLSHSKYFKKYVSKKIKDYYVNSQDAASLFLRLLSETGLFGLTVFVAFILRCKIIKPDSNNNTIWVINNAIIMYFVIRLIRNGHYFNEGFYLFFWMYYFSYKIALMNKTKIANP